MTTIRLTGSLVAPRAGAARVRTTVALTGSVMTLRSASGTVSAALEASQYLLDDDSNRLTDDDSNALREG